MDIRLVIQDMRAAGFEKSIVGSVIKCADVRDRQSIKIIGLFEALEAITAVEKDSSAALGAVLIIAQEALASGKQNG